jgi:hypothetical protein
MAEVHLIRENARELHFAHRPMAGLVFAVIGTGFGWFFWARAGEGSGRWIGLLAGLFFAAVGMGAAFWRYELTFDLLQRRYTRRQGFWPSPKEEQGAFDEIESVTLSLEYRRTSSKSSSTSAVWMVGIKLRHDPQPIKVAEEWQEEKGYARFESLAKALRVSAVDATAGIPQAVRWEQLDVSLAQRAGSSESREEAPGITPLPPESRIEFSNVPGSRVIRLPAAGLSFGGLFLALFGFVFFFAAGFFAWAKVSGMPVRENPSGAAWVIIPVFAVVGLAIMALGAFAMSARDVVREDTGALIFSYEALGRHWLLQRIEKREIELVAFRDPTRLSGSSVRAGGVALLGRGAGSRQEVLVRSDRAAKRIGGDLSDSEREWLRNTLRAMATG